MKIGRRKRCGKCRSCGKNKRRFSHSSLDLRSTLPTTPAAAVLPQTQLSFYSLLSLLVRGGGRTRVARAGLLACLIACVSLPLLAQSDEGAGERKVVTRVEPKYPVTLERLYIGGVVRLQVDIAANGTGGGAPLLGGNTIFGQGAD